jgi:tetratricopeptide (TPR) repeat protein
MAYRSAKIFISCFVVIILTLIVYWESLDNQFTTWDDPAYILNNPHIKELSAESVIRIFTTPQYLRNYQPLVLVSYAVDYHYSQLNAYGYHLTNLIIHLCNTIFVLIIFYSLTKELIISIIVALFFGIHPMHVESVAWLSARSDLLFAFFYLSSIIFYLAYYRRSEQKRYYLFSLALFLLAILSKALAISLPLVLLLLDYYGGRKYDRKMLLEKIPYLIIAAAGGMIAFLGRNTLNLPGTADTYSFIDRVLLGSYSTIGYLWKILFPSKLCAIYYNQETINGSLRIEFWFYLLLFILILFVTVYSWRYSKKIFFGLMFFFLTIVPVLPFFNLPLPIMADRYSYLPSLGLFFLVAVGSQEFGNKLTAKINSRAPRFILGAILGLYIIWLGSMAYSRTKVWMDGVTLWSDVISFYPNDSGSYKNRGTAYLTAGKYYEAKIDFDKALNLRPDYPDALIGRGIAFVTQNYFNDALKDFSNAITYDPQNAPAYFNQGFTLSNLGRFAEAIQSYSRAIGLKHDYGEAYVNRGLMKLQLSDTAGACSDLYHAAKDLHFKPAEEFYYEICLKK